jgi:hypothetical protein
MQRLRLGEFGSVIEPLIVQVFLLKFFYVRFVFE